MIGLQFVYMKRLFDFFVASVSIIILSPAFVFIALLIKITDNGPIFFCQERVGVNFHLFSLYKFRTMNNTLATAGPSITVKGDFRVTPTGRLLRKTKLDELPQLFNVFKGEMSLVGPRPEVPRYVEIFKEDYKTVLSVRPGITDYAAIEYRNEEETLARYHDPADAYVKEILPAKIALYKKYISEQSFTVDLKIIVRTLWKILN